MTSQEGKRIGSERKQERKRNTKHDGYMKKEKGEIN
jgi:hypothetical protein